MPPLLPTHSLLLDKNESQVFKANRPESRKLYLTTSSGGASGTTSGAGNGNGNGNGNGSNDESATHSVETSYSNATPTPTNIANEGSRKVKNSMPKSNPANQGAGISNSGSGSSSQGGNIPTPTLTPSSMFNGLTSDVTAGGGGAPTPTSDRPVSLATQNAVFNSAMSMLRSPPSTLGTKTKSAGNMSSSSGGMNNSSVSGSGSTTTGSLARPRSLRSTLLTLATGSPIRHKPTFHFFY